MDETTLLLWFSRKQSRRKARAKAVLAPILGNEVGNSSIETISVFFRQISLGKSLKGALGSARAR